MKFRNRLFAAALAIALGSAAGIALAQSPGSLQGNYTAIPYRPATYSVSYKITTAASLTDFMAISGSATKTIYVRRASCSGNTTAAGSGSIALIKRSTADTGGTAVTPSASVGGQNVPHDSSSAAATATTIAYSANPTLGTAVGVVRFGTIATDVAATGAGSRHTTWEFDLNAQSIVLRGVAQQLALGGLGTALPAGAVLTCSFTWIEQ